METSACHMLPSKHPSQHAGHNHASHLVHIPPRMLASPGQGSPARHRRSSLRASAQAIIHGPIPHHVSQQQLSRRGSEASLDSGLSDRQEPLEDLLGWPHVPSDLQVQPEEVLGHGEYGTVCLGVHKPTGRQLAVKMIRKHRHDRTPEQHLLCIRQEAELWARCQRSPYVTQLQGLYQDELYAYIVQERAHGGDLKSLIKRRVLSEPEAAQVMVAVLDVVQECHSHGHTFGDVKLANFLLRHPYTQPGEGAQLAVIACDFGCAQHVKSRSHASAASMRRMGSPVYMAPELWQATGGAGLSVDLWAAGVLMYLLLSGRYPFWPQQPEQVDGMPMHAVMLGLCSSPVLFQGEPWGRVSPPCKDLILSLLDRQASTRISAREALEHPWFRAQLGYIPQPTSDMTISSLGSVDSLLMMEQHELMAPV